MKSKIALIIMVTVVIMLPLYAFGQVYSDYFTLNLGQYYPTGDLDELDSGVGGEVSFGSYNSENFSYETSVGYFKADETFNSFVSGVGNVQEKDEIQVTTASFTLKGHIPLDIVELYAGIGFGVYFAKLDIDLTAAIGSLSFSDSDTVLGGHILAGINFNITDQFFLGLEGKWFATDDFNFSDTDQGISLSGDLDIDGYIIFGKVGFRF